MSSRLHIGGLSWDTGEASLRQAFEPCGNVREVKVITDRETGRSRGFGFVTFSTGEEAQEAIRRMDGAELDGRSVKVSIAQERQRSGLRRDRS